MKQSQIIKKLSCIFIIIFSTNAQSVSLTMQLIEGWVEENEKGFALEVFNAINNEVKIPFELYKMPTARAFRYFSQQKTNCFLGGDKKAAYEMLNINVLASEPFLTTSMIIMTATSQPKISSLKQLEGKTLGVEFGVNLNIFDVDFSKIQIAYGHYKNQLQMLALNRLDARIGYYPDKESTLKNIHFDRNLVLYSNDDSLICHVTEENRQLISRFNLGLRTIKQNGVFKKLWNKYFEGLNPLPNK